MARVQVAVGKSAFVTSGGEPFTPFGLTYFRPETGWAPQVWKTFDPDATRADFMRMKAMGVNVVRVFLTLGSFLPERGRIDPEALAKLDRFLAIAEEAGIRVHPTGPDHWEGVPDWAKVDRIADDGFLATMEAFWTELAGRYRGRGVIFAYDLLNEPVVAWDTPAMKAGWSRWLESTYKNPQGLAAAWGDEAGGVSPFEAEAIPPRDAPVTSRRLRDYQRYREDVAVTWTRRQAAAIKAADPEALVTVGLLQFSVPLNLGGPEGYAGFRPERLAPLIDFLEVHFYPIEGGFYTYRPEAEKTNLAYLAGVVGEVVRGAKGKPVVVAEYGWYGGGPLQFGSETHPPASEDDQARWSRNLVDLSANVGAVGWIHWGLYDQPEAGDVTQRIGLLRADGAMKAWGRVFTELARDRRLVERPVAVPAIDWEACTVDPASRVKARAALIAATAALP
ncbi:beta-galactosidase [Paludisphaera mucosa]|uniref:Beta-galactosidase n=1 Tax=Paludisphaera mucosa TaxID=3030827 RepID=A0ABT6F7P4_9BACT|nr:beta-galactosidase [Paludisphaera mucosa]MDG3003606.1 beta-galactosidase [Paludisphaera mucosa]